MTKRKISWTPTAWEDLVDQIHDKKTFKRIRTLLKECQRTPFEGIGKPEPLLGDLAGFWSRRIDEKNRLVYEVTEAAITVISCRYHYE